MLEHLGASGVLFCAGAAVRAGLVPLLALVPLTMFFWSSAVRPARHVPNKLALKWALDILASPDPPQELIMEWFRSVPSSARFNI